MAGPACTPTETATKGPIGRSGRSRVGGISLPETGCRGPIQLACVAMPRLNIP